MTIKGPRVKAKEIYYAQPCAARGSRESERRAGRQEGSRRESIMIRRGKKQGREGVNVRRKFR